MTGENFGIQFQKKIRESKSLGKQVIRKASHFLHFAINSQLRVINILKTVLVTQLLNMP